MANSNLLPGYGIVQETDTKQNLLPGYGIVMETFATAAPATEEVKVPDIIFFGNHG